MPDERPSAIHALVRISPKGGPFKGRCIQCGKTMMLAAMFKTPCPNPKGITPTQAILKAIEGEV